MYHTEKNQGFKAMSNVFLCEAVGIEQRSYVLNNLCLLKIETDKALSLPFSACFLQKMNQNDMHAVLHSMIYMSLFLQTNINFGLTLGGL